MQPSWYNSYDTGIPHEINPDQYQGIPEILNEAFDKYRDRPCFHNMGTSLTYRDIDILSKKFASYLQNQLKLEKGDRVALMMPNILQYPVALFGILRAGMVAVNVNPLYTAREIRHHETPETASA